MDPRLQSIHLEALPRREDFRRARSALQGAFGQHTIAGDIRPALSGNDLAAVTCVRGQEVVRAAAGATVCWLVDRGKALPLKVGLNSIGRLPDNDVVIDDPCVSRRHCAIVVHSDLTCELHDIASKNGTTINGKKLQGPTRLGSGDEICLCERRLTLSIDGKVPAPASVPMPRRNRPDSDDMTMAG